jgi:DNA-binding response OmpR family regulator
MAVKKILIADDEIDLRKILAEKFTKAGWQVAAAGDGEEVLAQLRSSTFDLMLLDLRMPKKTGFDVLTELKADASIARPVILVLSASGEENDIKKAIEMGAADYFVKVQDSLEKILKWADIYAGKQSTAPIDH